MIPLLFIVIAQILIPTPDWPDLQSPTPYMTTTPVPSATLLATPTVISTNTPYPTEAVTLAVPQDEVMNNLSTAQANLDDLQNSVQVSGEQVYVEGNPVLSNQDDTLVFGYIKWLISTGNESISGPFAPITWTLSILVLLAILSLIMFGVRQVVSLLFRVGWWIISTVLKFIPFIG